MKNLSRTVALFLCLAMVLSLAACGKTKENAPSTTEGSTAAEATQSPTGNTATNPYSKTLDISWLGFFCAGLPQEFWAKSVIEEKFNVKLTVPDVDSNADMQKVNLMVASGEMPDFFANVNTYVQSWFNEGVTRSIPVDIIRKAAPNYAKVMDENPAGWKLYTVRDKPDELMAMTGFAPAQASNLMVGSYYRLDWLEKIGMPPHGTLTAMDEENNLYIADKGFTRDEFFVIMDKFVNNDPDNNGKKDTLGFVGCNAGTWNIFAHTWDSLLGSFGLTYNNVEENGTTIEYYSSAKYKEFLKFAAAVYKNGYMDKEFLTNDFVRMGEKYAQQKAGYVSTQPAYMTKSSAGMWNRAPLNMIKDNPDAKLVFCPPEIGPNGEQGVPYNTNSPFKYSFYIGSSVDDEKLERILSIFDYAAASKEGFIKMSYGEEGVHYTIEDTKYGKARVLKENVNFNGKPDGLFVFSTNMFLPLDGRDEINTVSDALKLQKLVTANPEWTKYNMGPDRIDLFNTTGILAVNADVSGTISTIVNEFYAKSIAGEINVDAEWDNYMNNLNKAGYQRIITELNKAPKFTEVLKK